MVLKKKKKNRKKVLFRPGDSTKPCAIVVRVVQIVLAAGTNNIKTNHTDIIERKGGS